MGIFGTDPLVWESLGGYGGAGRHHPITFANETHAFLLTGSTYDSAATVDFYLFDESDESWTDISMSSAFPGEARSFGYGVVLNEVNHPKAYLGFGMDSFGDRLADWWEFDMVTHEWLQLADFPGPPRRHPAIVPVHIDGDWEIHVGLGDGPEYDILVNLNDYWRYDIESDTWSQFPDFPSSRRHHPFYFGIGDVSYVGLGHSVGRIPGVPNIERDWYSFHPGDVWNNETAFASYEATYDDSPSSISYSTQPVTTEARVAGTQFSIDLPLVGSSSTELQGSLGFVLSGDGDDHDYMEEGEFHAFYPSDSTLLAGPLPYASSGEGWWRQLPPHPGQSRWAPGSFVMRGTARAYFTSGYNRFEGELYGDLWRIDLTPLFLQSVEGTTSSVSQMTTPQDDNTVLPPPASDQVSSTAATDEILSTAGDNTAPTESSINGDTETNTTTIPSNFTAIANNDTSTTPPPVNQAEVVAILEDTSGSLSRNRFGTSFGILLLLAAETMLVL